MWLIQAFDQNGFQLVEYLDAKPPYAVLSHTWGPSVDEVTQKDLISGHATTKKGYEKLVLCRDQARFDGLEYFWIDSVCIDKTNAVELQESIISMFRWYQEAAICYVYMSDVSVAGGDDINLANQSSTDWPSHLQQQFCQSRYFTRGWTLQELLAPPRVKFFSNEGRYLGDKTSLEYLIHHATSIEVEALRGRPLRAFSIDTRISWVAKRNTTRPEDAVYSLFGLFGVCIPVLYGEGKEAAMRRLRRTIDEENQKILIWWLKTNTGIVFTVVSITTLILMAFNRLSLT